jgi:hypothetical protein
MFIYNSYDYLSYQIQLNQSLQGEATLNMLNALKYFTNKYSFENEDIAIIDIGANVGWYTTFFGYFKYTVLSFESLPENNYILKKNFCRNNKDFFGNLSTVTIINEVLYPSETYCDYYKDKKNSKKNLVLCDKSKEKNLDKDYIKFDQVKTTKLINFLPLITKVTFFPFNAVLPFKVALYLIFLAFFFEMFLANNTFLTVIVFLTLISPH